MLGKKSADHILTYFSYFIRKKKGFDISCKLGDIFYFFLENRVLTFHANRLQNTFVDVLTAKDRIGPRICANLFEYWLSAWKHYALGYPTNSQRSITKTCPYNFDPRKPHFYIVKLGFTGVCIIFLISAQKHRLWVLVRTASPRRF